MNVRPKYIIEEFKYLLKLSRIVQLWATHTVISSFRAELVQMHVVLVGEQVDWRTFCWMQSNYFH